MFDNLLIRSKPELYCLQAGESQAKTLSELTRAGVQDQSDTVVFRFLVGLEVEEGVQSLRQQRADAKGQSFKTGKEGREGMNAAESL